MGVTNRDTKATASSKPKKTHIYHEIANGKPATTKPSHHKGSRSGKNLSHTKKPWKESRRIVFSLGAILGLAIAIYAGAVGGKSNSVLFENFVNFESLQDYVDDWKEVLPQSLSSLVSDFQKRSAHSTSLKDLTESFAVGKQLHRELHLRDKHPVIMVPGVISTGIESWGLYGDNECSSEPHFRKRLWGSFYMLKTMVLDKMCWLKHVMLDPETGLDPPNFTLRAAQGFEASDFFMAGYWIWNKVLQNLGAIGYDPNKMATAAYDWRLAYLDLERRDSYFSKLKQKVELDFKLTGEKAVLVGHSMGSQIIFYFLKWVEAEGPLYGNGGPDWVENYVDSFVNVAGTLLGVPKSVPALISGEMKDTIQLNALAMYGLEKFFSRKERLDMIQTWGGVPSMLPKGGSLIWGDHDVSVEDTLRNATHSYGKFIRFDREVDNAVQKREYTMSESLDLLMDISPSWLQKRVKDQYTFGFATSEGEMIENQRHHSHWSNPLEVPLPNAPGLKIYCIYGVGNPTERAYVYKEDREHPVLNFTIDYENSEPVSFSDGDGTVPLVTHAMCQKWAQGLSPYNPGNSTVKVIEIKHQPDRFDIRGGAQSAEHVDILGSAELNEYILKVAGGVGDTIEPRQISDMKQWVQDMPFPM
ncbi:LANO_0A02498g1_1 [Lachancea nothofagi CBS 11611]|uniref:Phospholipid:diacylglycerol acyltransferase n=1 Tax=Lachancea nothofagi CBS 11611 TaxID=1266666 RepID=A0A1G4IP09_9SACH|nr:LANO_0A02498g1_1 [Lachancea nothofagi CBS 11611]